MWAAHKNRGAVRLHSAGLGREARLPGEHAPSCPDQPQRGWIELANRALAAATVCRTPTGFNGKADGPGVAAVRQPRAVQFNRCAGVWVLRSRGRSRHAASGLKVANLR